MQDDESQVDRAMTFFGLWGEFPIPDNDMPRMISLPRHKEEIWASIARDFSPKGAMRRKRSEKLIGGLPFTQTSVFGRFGRTALRPLRDNLKWRHYAVRLSAGEIDIARRLVLLLKKDISRVRAPQVTTP